MAVEPKTYKNILKYGLQASYDALVLAGTVDADVLYFCTDTGKLYKGTVDFTDSVIFRANKTGLTAGLPGKVYLFADSGTTEVWDDTLATPAWRVISYPLITTIYDEDDPTVTDTNDDVHVPSAKAVYDFVEHEIGEIIGGGDVVKSIRQKTSGDPATAVRGTFTYTTGDDVDHDVQLTGVVTRPSYDATTRTFTFPVAGESDVEVELGKDIFIDPTADNRYQNGYIYLYLNDGSASSDPTELAIPVTGLITDYFGDDTDSIQVDIDNSTHKVTAQAILKPDVTTPGSEWENALKVSSTAGANGLYVDLSGVEADIEQLDTNMAALNTARLWGTF